MKHLRPILFYAIFFLFFLQLLTDFIAAIYAFGLLNTSIPPELGLALLLFAPALLLGIRRPHGQLQSTLFLLVIVARLIEPGLDTQWRLLISGLGVAAWLILFPILLWRHHGDRNDTVAADMMWGVMLGVILSGLLRVLGSGVDVSTMGLGQGIGAILAFMGLSLWFTTDRKREEWAEKKSEPGFKKILALSLGLMTVLVLMYYAFAAPYVMARWTGVDASVVLLTMIFAWTAYAWTATRFLKRLQIGKNWLFLWGLAFALAIFFTLSNNQPWLPDIPHLYPRPDTLAAPHPLDCTEETAMCPAWRSLWHAAPLVIMLLLSPGLLLIFHRQLHALRAVRPSLRQLGGAFTVAALFLLLAIFAHIFTTVYDYIPVIGPLFRNAFPLVYLLVTLMLLPGILATGKHVKGPVAPRMLNLGVVLLAFVIMGGHILLTAHPQSAPPQDGVTILTYNIQQGYSAEGRKNEVGQLALIRQIHPDIIGLQESDSARIANSNDDLVRYFANHLHMHHYYGPKTVVGTFGIALLSRYPIYHAETFYLYSKGEQVAVIRAEIEIEGRRLHVLVTHLGNGGPLIQQEQLLELVGDAPGTVVMGDFNFRPDTEQYAITTQLLRDSWTQRWPDWKDDQGRQPRDKIDHIFISPDLQVIDVSYYPKGPSDHPAMTAVIDW